jgi:molybdopterin-guanine dinucleotide biosynthesis protein A
MGGVAKGLLKTHAGETYVDRWIGLFRTLSLSPILVGAHEAYANVPIEQIADAAPGIGPLGGLVALLERGPAIAVACDMPFVSRTLLERLRDFPSDQPIVAPKRDGKWEPLFARYDVRALELARENARVGKHSLQSLLDVLAAEMPLSIEEAAELEDRDR